MADPAKTNMVRFEQLEEAVLELRRGMQAMQETSVTTQTLLQELASRSSSRDSDRRRKASKRHLPKDSPPSSPHSTSSKSSGTNASAESENDGSRSSLASDTETDEGRTTATDKNLCMHSHEIQGKKKVTLAAYHLEGKANQWWQWYNRSHDGKTISWHKFEKGILCRFGPTDFKDYDEALSKIKQRGTFREYQQEFEKLANRVTGWPKKALLGAFMGGLKEDIAIEVCMFRPKGLKNAIDLAKRQDEKLQRGCKPSGSVSSNTRLMGTAIPTNTTTPLLTTKPAPMNAMKHLPFDEMRLRPKSPFDVKKDDEEELPPTDIPTDPLISLHALSGSIGNLTPITPFYVRVASGEKLACQAKYEKVPICIQGFFFETTLFALPIRGLDLVLGYQWLEGLGCVVHDYARRSMEFAIGNRKFIIQAEPMGPSMVLDVNALLLEWKHGAKLFCLAVIESEPALPVDSTPNLNPEIHAILLEHQQVLNTPQELPPSRTFDHRILLKNEAAPVNVVPYRYAHFQKNEIERQVEEMLSTGLICPSTSPFSFPVLLVKKKDGTWRFCTNYRALNKATIKDRFPIPTNEDMLDELFGTTYFSKLDLRAGYHQIRVQPDDVHKTAFRTHHGHFEYLVMPFGFCNAPLTFQAAMNSIFKVHLRHFILAFFYDILIYSKTWPDHLRQLRTTLGILVKHFFYIKPSKCIFGQQEVEYLSHIITPVGVTVDSRKIDAMLRWPPPKNITALRGFLGLIGYYRKFVRNYGLLARPLTQLLRKGQFAWSEEADCAFASLKTAMTTTPILALPNFSKDFMIETDASGLGMGAMLSQNDRPIAFLSKAIELAKKSWSTYEILVTLLTGQTVQNLYKPKKSSSSPRTTGLNYELVAISGPIWEIWDDLRKATKEDAILGPLERQLQADPLSVAGHNLKNGCIMREGHILVPEVLAIKEALLHEFHNSTVGGHSGILRTYKRLLCFFTGEA
ncbi:uncharacterized protein LOC122296883 [Carya illinoinensis]|uniref:uncharacterized protein LOC122296883 n=1 Tax=Carya illinoinensis TaxID=32201 RepID=UPI001C721D77|nr:uncharacterized protein LOC122296883 [Carya illinoinensis]